MAVTNTDLQAGPYFPNGAAASFAFAFRVLTKAELTVYRGEPGAWAVVDPAQYDVVLGATEGGSVVFPSAPTSAAGPLYIVGDPEFRQDAAFRSGEAPFNPKAINAELERGALRSIKLRGDLNGVSSRALMAPDGQSLSAIEGARAGKVIGFGVDPNRPIAVNPGGADAALRGDLASGSAGAKLVAYRLHPSMAARPMDAALGEVAVSINNFEGSTVARLKAAANYLRQVGGGRLLLPRDAYGLDSAELAEPIMLYSNVVVDGAGSALQITGDEVIASAFRSENTSNVVIRDMLYSGNNRGIADASSGAFFNYLHDDAGDGAENIRLEKVRLQNIRAERWVSILNKNSDGKSLRRVFADMSAFSFPGNNPGPSSIGMTAAALWIYGIEAPIVDVEIPGFYAEADFIKSGIVIFGKVNRVLIDRPTILSAGQGDTENDKGAYAINVYGDEGDLTDVTINDPVITNPRSVGIYLRGVQRATVNLKRISGQTDTETGSLPKAAIATNGVSQLKIIGGDLGGAGGDANVHDLYLVASTTSTDLDVVVEDVRMRGATGAAVVLNPTSGAGNPAGARFVNCKVSAAGRAMQVLNGLSGSRSIHDLKISGGYWKTAGSSHALELNPLDGTGSLKGYVLEHCDIASAGTSGISFDAPAGTTTGDITLRGVTIEDVGTNALIYGILGRNFPGLFIDDVTVRNMGSGFATLTDGSRGTVNALKLQNVANGFSANSLGMIPPTGAGGQNWFVENLNPIELGEEGSKYLVTGHRHVGGAWVPVRAMTGG